VPFITIISNDPPFAKITRNHWIEFFSYLTTDYVSDPDGVAPRGPIKLAPKTIFNIHTNLGSLYAWCVEEEIADRNLIHTIDRPRYEDPVIEPFSRDEMAALLKACDKTRGWVERDTIHSSRYTAVRDRCIIRLLLDTGVRAEELCDPDEMIRLRAVLVTVIATRGSTPRKPGAKMLF